MTPDHPFRLFGPSHWATLGAIAVLTTSLVLLARRARGAPWRSVSPPPLPLASPQSRPPSADRLPHALAVGLAALLLLDEAAVLALAAHDDLPTLATQHLPFQLCDWAVFACAAALLWRLQTAYELAWFWGLGGTLQAVLTPDLAEDFPGVHFLTFQLLHAGVIVAALYLTLGLGMRPRPRSVLRAWLWLQAYAAVTALADWLLGANYGYLRHKPASASLLDHLGPWPWYLLSLEALSLVLFLACYAPFALHDRPRRGAGEGRR
jgi:hypothetical integral membrane protein (TIGR02206 family)